MTETGKVRLADWLMAALHDLGITQAFMVAGGGAMHLNDALGFTEGIDVVATLHEQGASLAADAYRDRREGLRSAW